MQTGSTPQKMGKTRKEIDESRCTWQAYLSGGQRKEAL